MEIGQLLRLLTFGGLSLVEGGGGEVPGAATQRRPLALLALLAAAGPQGLSREKILLYLWPESDMERGRNALRQLVHGIRRDLGADLLTGTADLRLNPTCITSDVAELEDAIARGAHGDVATLYRGPFLDGFHLAGGAEFERWTDERRAHYAGRVATALESLAQAAGARGDPRLAAQHWRRLAELDPLDGRYALGLIASLAESGSPAKALQHARVYETLVREELGTAPDPAVAALVQRIRTAPPAAHPAADSAEPLPAEPRPTDADRSEVAERIGAALGDRYAVERELDRRDGVSRVFVAHDRRYDRRVALKVLHPDLASRLDRSRFLREIALTARLQHPAILPVLDSGEVGGQPWYATPYVEGESLRDRLGRRPLPIEEAIRLGGEIAGALDYAHRHGVVHRDVRPENVVLTEGHALVVNFVVARAIDVASGEDLTGTGTLVGAPAYMAPEQLDAGGSAGPRADIYSLGALLYEMVTGEPLYSGPTAQAIVAKRQRGSVLPPRMLRAEIPAYLERVISKAIATRPEDRFGSAAELGAALVSDTGVEDASLADARPRWMRRLAFVLAALAIVGMTGLVCWRS